MCIFNDWGHNLMQLHLEIWDIHHALCFAALLTSFVSYFQMLVIVWITHRFRYLIQPLDKHKFDFGLWDLPWRPMTDAWCFTIDVLVNSWIRFDSRLIVMFFSAEDKVWNVWHLLSEQDASRAFDWTDGKLHVLSGKHFVPLSVINAVLEYNFLTRRQSDSFVKFLWCICLS